MPSFLGKLLVRGSCLKERKILLNFFEANRIKLSLWLRLLSTRVEAQVTSLNWVSAVHLLTVTTGFVPRTGQFSA